MRKIHLNINTMVRIILLAIQIIVVGAIIAFSVVNQTVDIYSILYVGVYFGSILNIMYTLSYITEKKLFSKKTRRFKALWLFWGIASVGCSVFNYFRYDDTVVLVIAVITFISTLVGALQLMKYKSTYNL